MIGNFTVRIGHSVTTMALLVTSILVTPAIFDLDRVEAGGEGKKLLQYHNRERRKKGKPRLRMQGSLNKAARKYAQQMAQNDHFSHLGPDGSTFSQRIKKETRGLQVMGENLAYGQNSAKEVHRAWMNSPGHRRNILSKKFRYVGFGKSGREPFWAAEFGG